MATLGFTCPFTITVSPSSPCMYCMIEVCGAGSEPTRVMSLSIMTCSA